MRILLIGGTGFIGRFVARELVGQGARVSVMHGGKKDLAALVPGALSLVNHEPLSSPRALETGLATKPDIVVHMLAMREGDARAASEVFSGRLSRLVFASSGDVYRAYGRFCRFEPGEIEPMPLSTESSPLRSKFYLYRNETTPAGSLEYDYEKIAVERTIMADKGLRAVCLRLPKVYGKDGNALETVYRYRNYPDWRWTHGYVENVAAAIALAAVHPAASGRIYNVGEAETPTMGGRLAALPPSPIAAMRDDRHDFAQDIVYDTTPIRRELGYREKVPLADAVRSTMSSA